MPLRCRALPSSNGECEMLVAASTPGRGVVRPATQCRRTHTPGRQPHPSVPLPSAPASAAAAAPVGPTTSPTARTHIMRCTPAQYLACAPRGPPPAPPTPAPALAHTLARELAPRVVLSQVEAECLLARQLLVPGCRSARDHRPDQQQSTVPDRGQGLRLHTAKTRTHRTLGAAALSAGPAETPTESHHRWPPARPASQPAGSSDPGPQLPLRLPVLPLVGPPSSWQGALAYQTARGSRGPQPPMICLRPSSR
jgi:hypothetical protein